jgi:hypothetical protein
MKGGGRVELRSRGVMVGHKAKIGDAGRVNRSPVPTLYGPLSTHMVGRRQTTC